MAKRRRVVLEAYEGVEPRTKAMCKVETTKNIVDGLIDFYNLVFYFI